MKFLSNILAGAALAAFLWLGFDATAQTNTPTVGMSSSGSRLTPRILQFGPIAFTNNSTANVFSNVFAITNLFLAAPSTHPMAVETIIVCNTNILSMQMTNGFTLSLDGVGIPQIAATNAYTLTQNPGNTIGSFVLTNFFQTAAAPLAAGWLGSNPGYYTNRQIQFIPASAFDGAAFIVWNYCGLAVPGCSTNATTTNYVYLRLSEVP